MPENDSTRDETAEPEGWTRLAVRFPPDLYARLEGEAAQTGTPKAVIVREAVDADLHRRCSARQRARNPHPNGGV